MNQRAAIPVLSRRGEQHNKAPNRIIFSAYFLLPPSTMSVVSLLGVNILNNPARFTDNYQFEITFECLEQLEKGEKLPFSPTEKPSRL